MNKQRKLELLDELLLDTYIDALKDGEIKPSDLGNIVSYLKNNKMVEDKKVHSESDVIDGLIDEI